MPLAWRHSTWRKLHATLDGRKFGRTSPRFGEAPRQRGRTFIKQIRRETTTFARRPVIAMNENALRRLRCEKRLTIVPGASHLFEEPGTLDEVVRLATAWFREHLRAKPATSRPPAARTRR
jgi:hypothetical protein